MAVVGEGAEGAVKGIVCVCVCLLFVQYVFCLLLFIDVYKWCSISSVVK